MTAISTVRDPDVLAHALHHFRNGTMSADHWRSFLKQYSRPEDFIREIEAAGFSEKDVLPPTSRPPNARG